MAEAGLDGHLIAGLEHGMAGTPGLADALSRVDLIVTNTAGRAAFAGQLPAGLPSSKLGVLKEWSCTTRGAAGRCPAVAVEAVDTTGAGDCFAGALCHYLPAGLDLGAAGSLAVAAAALSTRALGAQSALPTDAEVRAAAAGTHTARTRSEV